MAPRKRGKTETTRPQPQPVPVAGDLFGRFTGTMIFSALVSRVDSPEDESGLCSSLEELLDKESRSDMFVEGISYALFKVAERGLVCAAEILIRYGADLNFEGETR